MYFFTKFALQLNHLTPELKKWLPPTDSRLRPDLCALEKADLEVAANEKHRLEEKQRAHRRLDEAEKLQWVARYFKQEIDSDTGETYYAYCRDYWEDRRKGDWSHLRDIFSETMLE
eukprot:CAMPEP_0176339594 /NCGR_PEP_ID=MMETSP0126-20121128/896_1 /TAXON_ID=141414 ORGANISM="Strombidinopsis acuminatum, Strain SPMC142" /NCGR_SAMPLE_ID=MMETSP0126 /ASSEMBLY_ACC=CAM_ASM_000229 /LENGTH=115 /DNA_ID=CAMNT_0017683291 /DNA_START=1587 /DNA_END=1934 /DNA_ORIENTATION=+